MQNPDLCRIFLLVFVTALVSDVDVDDCCDDDLHVGHWGSFSLLRHV